MDAVPGVQFEFPQAITFDDDRLLSAAARACLAASRHVTLAGLTCQVIDGVIILHGSVETPQLKEVAHSAVSELCGARGIINMVEVIEPELAAATG